MCNLERLEGRHHSTLTGRPEDQGLSSVTLLRGHWMPDDEFMLPMALHWLSQEVFTQLKVGISLQNNLSLTQTVCQCTLLLFWKRRKQAHCFSGSDMTGYSGSLNYSAVKDTCFQCLVQQQCSPDIKHSGDFFINSLRTGDRLRHRV